MGKVLMLAFDEAADTVKFEGLESGASFGQADVDDFVPGASTRWGVLRPLSLILENTFHSYDYYI